MAPDEHLRPAKPPQFGEQLFAILHVGVIRLVVAEETPDRCQRPLFRRGIHPDGDREFGRAVCSSGSRRGCGEADLVAEQESQ